MKAFNFLAFGLLATMIASCSSDEVALSKKEVTATITGNISTSLKTRAHGTTWDNDQIGLFVFSSKYTPGADNIYRDNDNTEYTTEGGDNHMKFTPVSKEGIKFPSNGSSIYFKSYYPYQGSIKVANPIFTVNSWNQTTENASRALDLLVTNTSTDIEDDDFNIGGKEGKMTDPQEDVELKFKHIFSRIVLNIEANSDESQITKAELAGLSVSAANMSAEASYNVLDGGEITKVLNNDTFSFYAAPDGTNAYAIICPEVNPENPNYNPEDPKSSPIIHRIITFSLKDADGNVTRTYTWDIDKDRKEPLVFKPGYSYTWNIKLRGDKLAEGTLIGTILDWEDGGTLEEDLEFDKPVEETQP